MKKIVLTYIILSFIAFAKAQTTLVPGDVAIISFSAINDGFKMVFLKDVIEGTKVLFTDNGFATPTQVQTDY